MRRQPPPFVSAEALHTADILAQRYGCRPSDLFAIDDPYLAYLTDEAAALVALRYADSPERDPNYVPLMTDKEW